MIFMSTSELNIKRLRGNYYPGRGTILGYPQMDRVLFKFNGLRVEIKIAVIEFS